jgi:hypothetical protein
MTITYVFIRYTDTEKRSIMAGYITHQIIGRRRSRVRYILRLICFVYTYIQLINNSILQHCYQAIAYSYLKRGARLVVIGDVGVGKSALTSYFMNALSIGNSGIIVSLKFEIFWNLHFWSCLVI